MRNKKFRWQEDDDIGKIWEISSPFKREGIKKTLKKQLEDDELAFIMGRWPPPTEGPENARKGEELGSFRKDICEKCHEPMLVRMWGIMFDQPLNEVGLCERCNKHGFTWGFYNR